MDIVIESTSGFEKYLDQLGKDDKAITVKKINDCASLFPTQKKHVYRKLHRFPLLSGLNGYESSLYTLKVSQKLRDLRKNKMPARRAEPSHPIWAKFQNAARKVAIVLVL